MEGPDILQQEAEVIQERLDRTVVVRPQLLLGTVWAKYQLNVAKLQWNPSLVVLF